MAYVSSDLPFPAQPTLLHNAPTAFASVSGAIPSALRRRWIYHRTLSQLERYSERDLRDFGANHGIEEFARRAAGL